MHFVVDQMESQGASDSSGPSSSTTPLTETISYVTPEEQKAKRKKYLAERDATKVCLYAEQFERWRQLKEEVKAESDKDVAALLLDS